MATDNTSIRRGVPDDIAAAEQSLRNIRDGSTLPKILSVYLPETFPIPDAREFNPLGSVDSAVAGVAEITGAMFQVPPGCVGVIRSFSIYITNMLTTTDVRFTFTCEGGPIPGYGALAIFPRSATAVTNSFDSGFRIPSGAKLQAFFNNVDGGSYKIGASYSGFYYPESSAARWMKQGPIAGYNG